MVKIVWSGVRGTDSYQITIEEITAENACKELGIVLKGMFPPIVLNKEKDSNNIKNI